MNDQEFSEKRGIRWSPKDLLEKLHSEYSEALFKIEALEEENKTMRSILKIIWDTDALQAWTFEDTEDQSIASMVRDIVKDSR